MERKKLPKSVRLIRQEEVVRVLIQDVGVSKNTAYKMTRANGFPKPVIDVNKRSRWWNRAQFESWLEGRS